VFLVLAKSGSQDGPFNMSVLIVPRSTPGLTVRAHLDVHGLATSAPAEITFEDCRLTPECLLGTQGAGLGVLLGIMQWERSCILAGLLGALKLDIKRVSSYLGQRRASGTSPMQHQSVAHAVARLSLRTKAARLMLHRGAWELDHGNDKLVQPAMSKLMISETLLDGATELLRLTAGFGWSGGLGLGQALDDVVGTLSASGTSEIQLNTIAAGLVNS
jgi:alkylation response protein AidB-like acyl-CoA dehydrogenase